MEVGTEVQKELSSTQSFNMLSFSIFFSKLSLFLNVTFFSAIHISFSSALQVHVGDSNPIAVIGAGYNYCDHVQEFACNNDICDVCAGSATDGRCRNGSNDTTCAIGSLCNIPDAGHCLENTWCTPGKHTMPTLGTPKHFRCVSVRGIDAEQVLVVYSNNDWTGDSCYIDGNGVWGTPNEDEANSIDVLRSDTGNFKRCYFSGGSGDGEQKEIPKLPGTTTQQGTTAQPSNSAGQGSCINPDGADPGDSGVCVDLAQKFPDVNDTYYYSNGDSTASGGDRRRRSRILLKRVDEFRAPSKTTFTH